MIDYICQASPYLIPESTSDNVSAIGTRPLSQSSGNCVQSKIYITNRHEGSQSPRRAGVSTPVEYISRAFFPFSLIFSSDMSEKGEDYH